MFLIETVKVSGEVLHLVRPMEGSFKMNMVVLDYFELFKIIYSTTDNIEQITDFSEQSQKLILLHDHTYICHYVEKQGGLNKKKIGGYFEIYLQENSYDCSYDQCGSNGFISN